MAAKKRKRILTILFIAFNAGVILWTALSEFAGKDSAVKFHEIQIKWWFIIPACFSWLIAIAAETVKYCLLMKELCVINN